MDQTQTQIKYTNTMNTDHGTAITNKGRMIEIAFLFRLFLLL